MMSTCDYCRAMFNDGRERYELRSQSGNRLLAVTCSDSCASKYAKRMGFQLFDVIRKGRNA